MWTHLTCRRPRTNFTLTSIFLWALTLFPCLFVCLFNMGHCKMLLWGFQCLMSWWEEGGGDLPRPSCFPHTLSVCLSCDPATNMIWSGCNSALTQRQLWLAPVNPERRKKKMDFYASRNDTRISCTCIPRSFLSVLSCGLNCYCPLKHVCVNTDCKLMILAKENKICPKSFAHEESCTWTWGRLCRTETKTQTHTKTKTTAHICTWRRSRIGR